MKKSAIILLFISVLLFGGCSSGNDEILIRIDELEQKITELEQTIKNQTIVLQEVPKEESETMPENTAEPTDIPAEAMDPIEYFVSIVPDSFVMYSDKSTITDASVLKENNMYGISLHYSVPSDTDMDDIKEYYKKVTGDDSGYDDAVFGSGALFQNEKGDVYYASIDQMQDGQIFIYSEVQFLNDDLSEIINDPYLALSNYYLDEIFAESPTMQKIGIVTDEFTEKNLYYEYKYEETDYDEKLKQVYAGHNIELIYEDEFEIIYKLSDNVQVKFEIYDGSNRVNVDVIYYK